MFLDRGTTHSSPQGSRGPALRNCLVGGRGDMLGMYTGSQIIRLSTDSSHFMLNFSLSRSGSRVIVELYKYVELISIHRQALLRQINSGDATSFCLAGRVAHFSRQHRMERKALRRQSLHAWPGMGASAAVPFTDSLGSCCDADASGELKSLPQVRALGPGLVLIGPQRRARLCFWLNQSLRYFLDE